MMQQIKGHRLKIMMMLCVCAATCSFVGCDDSAVPDHNVFSTAAEQTRVTSPDGRLDAVLVRDPYGPAAGGGVDWDVYIVTKGSPIRMKTAHNLFRADPLTGGHLVWKENHLLEIHYDIAYIHEFRNLWGLYEVENVGRLGEHDYLVEIRLVPSSDFSFLTPDGTFRSRD